MVMQIEAQGLLPVCFTLCSHCHASPLGRADVRDLTSSDAAACRTEMAGPVGFGRLGAVDGLGARGWGVASRPSRLGLGAWHLLLCCLTSSWQMVSAVGPLMGASVSASLPCMVFMYAVTPLHKLSILQEACELEVGAGGSLHDVRALFSKQEDQLLRDSSLSDDRAVSEWYQNPRWKRAGQPPSHRNDEERLPRKVMTLSVNGPTSKRFMPLRGHTMSALQTHDWSHKADCLS